MARARARYHRFAKSKSLAGSANLHVRVITCVRLSAGGENSVDGYLLFLSFIEVLFFSFNVMVFVRYFLSFIRILFLLS
jgi:hypothetical protein